MKILKEFKEFAVKGNVFDMAIGIIIGTAFSKIVSSLVNDIILPPIGLILGDVPFSELKWLLKEAQMNEKGEVVNQAITVNYGSFLQVTIDFLIIAFVIFLVIKGYNTLRRKAEEPAEEKVPTPSEIQLLSEIRDLLKERK